jgi:competence protein CoiA
MGKARVDAAVAVRGPEYRCPGCKGIVILHKGRKVIHHFKHTPPTNCAWASGETQAHLEAKRIVVAALTTRGQEARIECVLAALPGDRRADVLVTSPKGQLIAFELQHTPIGIREIERRSFSYATARIAQIWIPFVRASVWKDGKPTGKGWFVERYAAQPYERWIHGLCMKRGMWVYDPNEKTFWLGRLDKHELFVDYTSWYSEGEEHTMAADFLVSQKNSKN